MKLLLILIFSSGNLFASPKSINPNRMIDNLFSLNSKKIITDQGVKVKGIKYNEYTEKYDSYGNHFNVSEKTYDRAIKLSQSVYRASPGEGSGHGTAFHITGNLILTSQHVLSPSRKNTTQCKSFRIQLNANQKNKTVKCKKVHFCEIYYDFCLIEMQEHRKGYSVSKDPDLTLTSKMPYSDETKTMVIGNPMGAGLHASTGFGLEDLNSVLKFYAPVFGGNSGGPVFNENNEVIGITRTQTLKLISNESYNTASPMRMVLEFLNLELNDRANIKNLLKKVTARN